MSLRISVPNITNATVEDSFTNGSNDPNVNFNTGEGLTGSGQYAANWFNAPWNSVMGPYNRNLDVLLNSAGWFPPGSPYIPSYDEGDLGTTTTNAPMALIIRPNEGYQVKAEYFEWVSDNPDATTSDGLASSDIIQSVEFIDSHNAPSAMYAVPYDPINNIVWILVYFKDDWVLPISHQNYVIKLDFKGDALPIGLQYANVAIVNDFAETIFRNKNVPADSQIQDMVGSIQNGTYVNDNNFINGDWDEAFYNKKPLKYRGEVPHWYSPQLGDKDIESVKFTPAIDALGNEVSFHDTRDNHIGGDVLHENGEVVVNSQAEGLPAFGIGDVGFLQGSRKDVIYVGLHLQEGVPIKLGTITLKLQQDMYAPKDKETDETAFLGEIPVLEWKAGKVEAMGRTNGWGAKFSFYQDPEMFMQWTNFGMIEGYSPDRPTGIVPISRYDPSHPGANIWGQTSTHLYEAGDVSNLGYTYTQDQQDKGILPAFGMMYSNDHEMKNFMTLADEMWPNPYDSTYESFGIGYGTEGEDQDYLADIYADNPMHFSLVQDVNQYIIQSILSPAELSNSKVLHVYTAISHWSRVLYDMLDLHPWGFFPTFSNNDEGNAYSPGTNPTNGESIITKIDEGIAVEGNSWGLEIVGGEGNPYAQSGGQKFEINNFQLKSWAPPGWVEEMLVDVGDPSSFGGSYATNLDPYTGNTVINEGNVNSNFPNTITAWQNTTNALSSYIREVSFDVWYTHDGNVPVELDSGTGWSENGFGFDTDGTPGLAMSSPEISPQGGILMAYTGNTVGFSCNIKWDYMPWKQIIDLGGNMFNEYWIEQGGRRSISPGVQNFTNTSITVGEQDRLEIKEVNLSLGSTNGSTYENIIGQGGIGPEDDATVEVVGDPGAMFRVAFTEVKEVEITSGGSSRSAGSDSVIDTFLDGGVIPMLEGIDEFTIPRDGLVRFRLPSVRPLTSTTGWKEFVLSIDPINEGLIANDHDYVSLNPYKVCERELDAQPIGSVYHETSNIPECHGEKTYMVYPPGYYDENYHMIGTGTWNIISGVTNTVINSRARKKGDMLISPNSTTSRLLISIKQYPNVRINVTATKDGTWSYDTNYSVGDQIPAFAYNTKNLGKPFGIVDEMTFIRENEKNISFEIRVHKSSSTFKVNPRFSEEIIQLNSTDYNNSTTINHPERHDLAPGMGVVGEGIPTGSQIVSIINSTSFQINASTTGGSQQNQTLSLTVNSIKPDIFVTDIKGNLEQVDFTHLVAHIGRGLSSTDAEYATLAGRIRYRRLGEQSQVFNVDLTDIFINT